MSLFRPGTPMRARLLGRLNRVFDKEPGAVLALRIRSAGGLRWKVRAGFLTVERPELPPLVLALEGRTIAQLRDELAGQGVFIATYADDPAILVLGALALIEGAGDQATSNGDHLYAYTSYLYGWASALGRWLDIARADIPLALRQLVIPQSEGEWSELHASYFGLARKPEETDARLNFRTVYEWRRARSNPLAIQANIKALLDANVRVREPWMEMFALSESALSGDHHMPDAREFCYHTAQLISADFLNWPEVMVEAEADRPAGTLYLPPVTLAPPRLIRLAEPPPAVALFASASAFYMVQDMDGMILSVNAGLSDSWVRGGPGLFREDWASLHAGPLPNPPRESFYPSTICKGEIVLSDGPAMGDLQGHFPGTMLVEEGEPMVMSGGAALSDYEHRLVWEPIDEWFEDLRGGAIGGWEPGPIAIGRTDALMPEPIGAGAAAASSTAAASLSTGILLAGAAAARSTATASLTTAQWISGTAAAQSSASASLTTEQSLTGAASATASASASLSTGIRLAGAASSAASASAELSTGNRMAGTAAAAASATASLSTGIRLAGSAAAAASATATLAGSVAVPYHIALSDNTIGTVTRDPTTGKAFWSVTVTTRGDGPGGDTFLWAAFSSANTARGPYYQVYGSRAGALLTVEVVATGDYFVFRDPLGTFETYAYDATVSG